MLRPRAKRSSCRDGRGVRVARDTTHDNRQTRRLVSAANSASERDAQDGDDEATYGRIQTLHTDVTWICTEAS